MDTDETKLQERLQARFAELPPSVQQAITSADVEKRLRELADKHKLHLDQWTSLENEVMLALLGFQRTEDLARNIMQEVGVTAETAAALSADISEIVFKPIREELERALAHPDAKAQSLTSAEAVRKEILGGTAPAAPAAAPAPAPAPAPKAERAPLDPTYVNTSSTERTAITGDPYREQVA